MVWPATRVPEETAETVRMFPEIDPVKSAAAPARVCPATMVPDVTESTVSVVPEIEPLNLAGGPVTTTASGKFICTSTDDPVPSG